MTVHETVCHAAGEAISEVFGDTTVPREQTLESLGNLKDTIETYMETLEGEISRKPTELEPPAEGGPPINPR